MTNVNVAVTRLLPAAGATNDGTKIGFIDSSVVDAQSDTITVTNAATVLHADLQFDASGVLNAATLATNVITLTSATTGAVTGLIVYK